MKLAKTDVAKTALKDLLAEDAKAAAGGNVLVSKSEGKTLDPANRRAELALREEGGKGTRVRADQIATRASTDASKVWDAFNVRGTNLLSKAEVKAIGAADPALAGVTQQAYLRARGLDNPTKAVRTFFETFDFMARDTLPRGRRIDARVGQPGRADVPKAVVGAFDHYYRAEDADWASVGLHEARIAGKPIYAVVTSTDGDEGFLEVFKKTGEPMFSARLQAGQLWAHDSFFGQARLADSLLSLDNAPWEDGMSEAPERLAAGQVPLQWAGDVKVGAAKIHHEDGLMHHIDLPPGTALTDVQQKVMHAAVALLWDNTFSPRIDPGVEALTMGPRGQGQMTIGEFTRPTDGKTYVVADWRDIDDASAVFYFTKTQDGLRLASQQHDG